MSMYNMVCGMNPLAKVLLSFLGLSTEVPARFRDIWTNADFTTISIRTRTGGGNREEYAQSIESLRRNPFFLSDADDELDSTYADFAFRFPERFSEEFKKEMDSLDPGTRSQVMDLITTSASDKMRKALEQLKNFEPRNVP